MTQWHSRFLHCFPFLIVFSYFIHFQLIFSMLSPLSILFLFVLGSLFYTLYLRVFSKQSPIILTVILLLILIATFLFLPSIWKSLYNQTLSIYRLYSTLVFYPFSINTAIQQSRFLLWILFLLLFLFMLALFDSLIRICRWPHLAAFLLIVLLIPCLLHHVPQPFTIYVLTIWIFLLLLLRSPSARSFSIYVFFLLSMSFLLILSLFIFPKETIWQYNKQLRDQTIAKVMTRFQQLFINENQDTIDLQEANDRFYVGAIHFQVQGTPQTYYLRTYSGANYNDNHWDQLLQDIYDSAAIDYPSILLQLDPNAAIWNKDPSFITSTVIIDDYRGSTRRIVPYFLASIDGGDPQSVNDSFLIRNANEATYQYHVWRSETLNSYLQTNYAPADLDSTYDRFALNFYTQINENEKNLFSNLQLKNPRYFTLRNSSMQEVASYVKDYLNEHVEYTLTPGSLPEGEDFLTYFLTKNHRGYCVHYATAATLMMRYYGYPARYVEGYRITAEDFNGNYANVRDFHAHAWVEIYDANLGWIPLEFTESAPMHSTQAENDINEPEQPTQEIEQTPPSVTQTPTEDMPTPSSPTQTHTTNHLIWLIIPFLYFLQLLIRHFIQESRCRQHDINASILISYHVMQKLQQYGLTLPAAALSIAQKARFSNDQMSNDEKAVMLDLLYQMKKQIKQLPLLKRLLLYGIYAIW